MLVSKQFLQQHVQFLHFNQAQFLLSPDQDFSIQGTQTHINYVKAFRAYWNMIIEEGDTPAYRAIINLFNASLFGSAFTPVNNPICGGDGKLEEELENYRSSLKNSISPLPDHPNIENVPDEEPATDPPSPISPRASTPSFVIPDIDVSLPGTAEPKEDPNIKPKRWPTVKKKVKATLADSPVSSSPEVAGRSTEGGRGDRSVEQTGDNQRSTRRTKRG